MDHYASGKRQGFKSLNYFNITDPTKCKDKLLWDKSDQDKISSLPIAELSTDSWEDPILQVTTIFIILYRVDFTVADLQGADLQGWSSSTSATYNLLST